MKYIGNFPVDSIIFDIDGVLIDTTDSYLLATLKTVKYYLKYILKHEEKPNLGIEDIKKFKKYSGYNQEWDIAYAIVYLYMINDSPSFENLDKIAGLRVPEIDFKIIKTIFQEYYLGEDLFKENEKKEPQYVYEKGLIYNETPLIKKETFEKIRKNNIKIGIFTGRPKNECKIALENLKLMDILEKQFIKSNIKKPAPNDLYILKTRMNSKYVIYVGDNIDDLKTAKEVAIPFIGVGIDEFKSNVDIMINDINIIPSLIKEK